jgi:hypothetical protein
VPGRESTLRVLALYYGARTAAQPLRGVARSGRQALRGASGRLGAGREAARGPVGGAAPVPRRDAAPEPDDGAKKSSVDAGQRASARGHNRGGRDPKGAEPTDGARRVATQVRRAGRAPAAPAEANAEKHGGPLAKERGARPTAAPRREARASAPTPAPSEARGESPLSAELREDRKQLPAARKGLKDDRPGSSKADPARQPAPPPRPRKRRPGKRGGKG